MPVLSVVVVSYGVVDLLERCLASLAGDAQLGHLEVIVVDNASPDESADLVESRFPWARLIRLPENRGFSGAVNAGAREARGDVLLLLNPDAALLEGTSSIEASLASLPDAWIIGLRQVDERGLFQLSVGPWPGILAELGRKFVQARLDAGDRRVASLLDRYLSRPRTVPWVAASSMLVRRDAFVRLGGFDEGFFLFFEDIDFCLRAWRAGGRVYYDPRVTVLHRRGASAGVASGIAHRAYRQSQLRFWEKQRGSWMRRLVRLYLKLRRAEP